MEYTLLRYRARPADVTALAVTADPGLAVHLVRHWRRAHPDEGFIAAVGDDAVLHCPPRQRVTAVTGRIAAGAGP